MASAIKPIDNHKALTSVINYDRNCEATIWSVPYDRDLQS
jgi:hypothetical protein